MNRTLRAGHRELERVARRGDHPLAVLSTSVVSIRGGKLTRIGKQLRAQKLTR